MAGPPDGGIRTARNVDHVSLTVEDLDRAVAFFDRVFGADLLYTRGPVRDDTGDWMLRQLGVHPRASAHVALMRLGPHANLELCHYTAPGQRHLLPRPVDPGAVSLGMAVGDLEAALAALPADYARPAREPEKVPDGPMAGALRVRLRAPGMPPLELVQPAAGRTDAYRPPAGWRHPEGRGLPTFRGLHHVGFTVADLDADLAFLTGPLGGDPIGRHRARLGAAVRDTALVRLGPVTNIELAHWSRVDGPMDDPPANSDVGGHHLALLVDDLDAAVAQLAALPGVRVLGEPQLVAEGGPADGERWVHFRAPTGFRLAALQLPDGRDTPQRRYGPAPSWRYRSPESDTGPASVR